MKLKIENVIGVFPNPARDFIQLRGIPDDEGIEISLLTVEGKVMLERVSLIENMLDVRFLAPGLYTLMISGRSISRTGRFIKL